MGQFDRMILVKIRQKLQNEPNPRWNVRETTPLKINKFVHPTPPMAKIVDGIALIWSLPNGFSFET